MGSSHKQLSIHCEVWWLREEGYWNRLFELRDEVKLFLFDSNFNLKDRFHEFNCLLKLLYLADIFSQLNGLALSLQESSITIFQGRDET